MKQLAKHIRNIKEWPDRFLHIEGPYRIILKVFKGHSAPDCCYLKQKSTGGEWYTPPFESQLLPALPPYPYYVDRRWEFYKEHLGLGLPEKRKIWGASPELTPEEMAMFLEAVCKKLHMSDIYFPHSGYTHIVEIPEAIDTYNIF